MGPEAKEIAAGNALQPTGHSLGLRPAAELGRWVDPSTGCRNGDFTSSCHFSDHEVKGSLEGKREER